MFISLALQSTSRKCGEIHSKQKELTMHINQCCNKKASEEVLVPINKATEQAAKGSDVSQSSIKKFRKDSSCR
jgi:hypothetical protein